ncbi:MAG TPA: PQQ-binding-like beta-propeller repeat protein [Polyangiaceae bacterium]
MRFDRQRRGARALALALASMAFPACAGASEPLPAASAPGLLAGPKHSHSPLSDAAAPEPLLGVAFTFNAGAPLSGPPGIAPDGNLLVGTTDGYLHSLRPDGSFRWSYTLRGGVLGRPAWNAEGLALASARRNGLYAVAPDGALAWVSAIPGGTTSAPVVDGEGKIWVTTGGGALLAFTARGGVTGFAKIGLTATLGPVLLDTGEIAVANVDGPLRVAGRLGRSETARFEGPLRELHAGPAGLFLLGAEGLGRFEARPLEERWVRADVNAVACTRPGLVTVEHGAARWISAAGEPGPARALPGGAGRASTCSSDGSLLVATEDGLLVKLRAGGELSETRIAPGRVLGLDLAPRGLVVVSYADGRLLGIEPP